MSDAAVQIIGVAIGFIFLGLGGFAVRYARRIHHAVVKIEEATNGRLDRRLDGLDGRLDKLEAALLAGQSEIVRLVTAFAIPKPRVRRS